MKWLADEAGRLLRARGEEALASEPHTATDQALLKRNDKSENAMIIAARAGDKAIEAARDAKIEVEDRQIRLKGRSGNVELCESSRVELAMLLEGVLRGPRPRAAGTTAIAQLGDQILFTEADGSSQKSPNQSPRPTTRSASRSSTPPTLRTSKRSTGRPKRKINDERSWK